MRVNMVEEVKKYITIKPSLADDELALMWAIWSNQLKQKKIECVEKIQGEPKLIEYLESNEKMTDFLYKDFKKLGDAL